MKKCDCCDALGEPGTTCRECGRGVHSLAARKTVWLIDEASRSFDWLVISDSKKGAERTFKRMWLDWCKATGAERDYWGDWPEAREVKLGVGYMDREVFKVADPH